MTADREIDFPIPLRLLGDLYAAEPSWVINAVRVMPEADRARLALTCFKRDELHDVALVVADLCSTDSIYREMQELAGDLAAECRAAALQEVSGRMREGAAAIRVVHRR